MSDERPLTSEELGGHLRELNARVVALEIRDDHLNVVATAEGEFGDLAQNPRECSFMLGGQPPPDTEDVQFIVASWFRLSLDRGRVLEIHDLSEGRIGPTVNLRIRLADGMTIFLWPAMPLGEQWTDRHTENR